MEYITRSPVNEPANMQPNRLSTATQSLTEREREKVENLLQSDVEYERRKRMLRKDDSGKPVDPEES
jgi:hypothetical protein